MSYDFSDFDDCPEISIDLPNGGALTIELF